MRQVVTIAAILSLVGISAQAEPVFQPQAASVLKQKQIEIGTGGQFGFQKSELVGGAGTTYKNRVWHIPLMARYGILDNLESRLVIPYTSAKDTSEGLVSTRNVGDGIGNIQLGAKWNAVSVPSPLALALTFDLPTANPKNNPGALGWRYSGQIQQGFNTHLQVIGDTPVIADLLVGHASLGYMNTGKYTTTTRARFNPSDLLTFNAAAELRLHRWVNQLSVLGEVVGNTALNHSKTNATTNGNDKGTVLAAGPSLQYQYGPVRTYAGVLFDAGKTTFRAYNQRVHFGVSLVFGAP
jgi:hypothetical protein